MKPMFLKCPSSMPDGFYLGFTPRRYYKVLKYKNVKKGLILTVRNDFGNRIDVMNKKCVFINDKDWKIIFNLEIYYLIVSALIFATFLIAITLLFLV